jgi:hypothetical protein
LPRYLAGIVFYFLSSLRIVTFSDTLRGRCLSVGPSSLNHQQK